MTHKTDKPLNPIPAPMALIHVDRALADLQALGLSPDDAAKHFKGMVASRLTMADFVLIERSVALAYLAGTGMAAPDAETLLKGLSTALQRPLQGDVNAAHIRAHRSGRPAKIIANPDLRTFVDARLPKATFTQIVAEVAANFPPTKRTSVSALSRYWRKHHQT